MFVIVATIVEYSIKRRARKKGIKPSSPRGEGVLAKGTEVFISSTKEVTLHKQSVSRIFTVTNEVYEIIDYIENIY